MEDSIKLYLDEDALDRDLVKALRSRNVDILTAQEAGLKRISDEEHLHYASSIGRTVFTFNRGDFVKPHNVYQMANTMQGLLFLIRDQ